MFVGLLEIGNTFEHHNDDADNDHPEQDQIKGLSCPGIGAKNCDKYFSLQVQLHQS